MPVTYIPRSLGSTLILTTPQVVITIGGNQVVFDEDTFQLKLKLDERWRFQFTVLDYAGTQQFSYRQQVVVTDATLEDRKSTRLNFSHQIISYAGLCF